MEARADYNAVLELNAPEYADDTVIDWTDEAQRSRLRTANAGAARFLAGEAIRGARQRRERRWDAKPAVQWRAAQLSCGRARGLATRQRR